MTGLVLLLVSLLQTSAPPQPAAGEVDRGKQLFMKHTCHYCHGTEGQGSAAGVRITATGRTTESFTRYVRRPGGQMPAYTNGPNTGFYLGVVYLDQSRPQEALAAVRKTPEHAWELCGLAVAYHGLGREQESDAALSELVRDFGSAFAYQTAEVYAVRGEGDKAWAWLDRAYDQHDAGLPVSFNGDPLLKKIAGDPRYRALLEKLRLPVR